MLAWISKAAPLAEIMRTAPGADRLACPSTPAVAGVEELAQVVAVLAGGSVRIGRRSPHSDELRAPASREHRTPTERRGHVSLARIHRLPHPSAGGALRGAQLARGPEPALAPRG